MAVSLLAQVSIRAGTPPQLPQAFDTEVPHEEGVGKHWEDRVGSGKLRLSSS